MQQLAIIVPIVLVIWVIIVGIRIGTYMEEQAKKDGPKMPAVPEKACPPHSWNWYDQPGMEKVSYLWCKRCKKTPRQVSEGF